MSTFQDAADVRRWHAPHSPTIIASRVREEDAEVAKFSDDEWPLGALGTVANARGAAIRFDGFPPQYRQFAKRAMWLLINERTPDEILNVSGTQAVAWLSHNTLVTESPRVSWRLG